MLRQSFLVRRRHFEPLPLRDPSLRILRNVPRSIRVFLPVSNHAVEIISLPHLSLPIQFQSATPRDLRLEGPHYHRKRTSPQTQRCCGLRLFYMLSILCPLLFPALSAPF